MRGQVSNNHPTEKSSSNPRHTLANMWNLSDLPILIYPNPNPIAPEVPRHRRPLRQHPRLDVTILSLYNLRRDLPASPDELRPRAFAYKICFGREVKLKMPET